MPDLYIITGSNGAGKSSIGPEYLPPNIRSRFSVFDGDLLFVKKRRELFPAQVPSPKEARKLAYEYVSDTFDRLVEESLRRNETFVYEGHFTNDATWLTPRRFKDAGFRIHLIFLGLKDPDISHLRVTDRVNDGGHYVDRLTIEANFYGNLEKLNQYLHLIDHLTIIDASGVKHNTLAIVLDGKITSAVAVDELPKWFIDYLPNVVALISD
ncbi:zeta toxin family protein [Parapedobacter koreensis]|uniref:Predicted ABC-type ATPase n=1 Tax=Parapedobacter koreensis TaxID=332977 RepID=A0A1H7U4F2_9SPHI|nr:zeta toxin family protein [Parapedobacter koreensis]SEL91684.1 Predicted ABC-type ATPase [Parapedobacter koreensis]